MLLVSNKVCRMPTKKVKKPACKKGPGGVLKFRSPVTKRCIVRCAKDQRRVGGVGRCKTYRKKDKILNKVTGKFVQTDGRVGRWVRGKSKINPSTGVYELYSIALSRARKGGAMVVR